MTEPYGARLPGWLDSKVIAATSRLPDNWLGLRLAIGLRRIVTMRLIDDEGFDVMHWGMRMRLHPRHNGCEKGALFTPQMYEIPERTELFAEINRAKADRRTFQFIDIGANVGLFSLLAASYAGSNANIIAIEPEPENIKRLRFNLSVNPNAPIRAITLALGERARKVALEIDHRDKGGTKTRPLAQDEHTDISVECRPLLDVLQKEAVSRIDALKIDVEGAEDAILLPFFRDAPESLWPNLIIIEDASGSWRTDLFTFLAERRYAISRRSKLNVMMRRLAA